MGLLNAQHVYSDVHWLTTQGFDIHVHMVRDHDPPTFVCQLWASGDDQAAAPILVLQWCDSTDPCPIVRLNERRGAEARALEPRLPRQGYFFQLGAFVDMVWTVFEPDRPTTTRLLNELDWG